MSWIAVSGQTQSEKQTVKTYWNEQIYEIEDNVIIDSVWVEEILLELEDIPSSDNNKHAQKREIFELMRESRDPNEIIEENTPQ